MPSSHAGGYAPVGARELIARTPGANFGTRTVTLRAGAGGGLDDQAVVVAEGRPQPRVDVAQPDRVASASPASTRADRSGSSPTPSSSTVITRLAAVVPGGDGDRGRRPRLPSSPCRTAFSTSGCRHRNGTATGSTSGAIRSVDLQPVAEPGLLEDAGSARSSAAPRRAW